MISERTRNNVYLICAFLLFQSSCLSCIEVRVRISTGGITTSAPLKRSTWKWSDKVGDRELNNRGIIT